MTSFGQRVWSALMAESKRLGRKVTEGEGVEVIQRLYDSASKERRKAAVDSAAEEVYALYPKKVGRDDALKAITKALKHHPKEYLLDKVSQFAAAVQAWPTSYRYFQDGGDRCPHCATFFNQGRYADEPREWRRAGARTAPERPKPAGGVVTLTDDQQAAIDAENEAYCRKLLAMPEPPKDTLEHAFWVEAHRNSAIAKVADAATETVLQIETEQRLRKA